MKKKWYQNRMITYGGVGLIGALIYIFTHKDIYTSPLYTLIQSLW
jgi:hypothetical protein